MSSANGLRIPKPKKDAARRETQDVQEQALQLLRAQAGAAHRKSIDPVYALSESFAQTFDFVGRQRVQEMAGQEQADLRGVSMKEHIRQDDGGFFKRFSEYGFRNGRLAAAILQGRGQMALSACIRRSAGLEDMPATDVRRKIEPAFFNERSVHHADDSKVTFYTDAHSAVMLTVSTTRTARQLLESIRHAADTLDEYEVRSYREIFPFLFDDEERKLAQQLTQRRRSMEEGGQRDNAQYRAVCTALDKTKGVMERKAQMKQRFLSKLEQMLANARAAEEIFQSEAYQKALAETLMEAQQTEGAQDNENGADGAAGAHQPAG